MKRAEVWQGYGGEWYVLTTHCRPRCLRRMERISESAFPEDHEDNDEKPFPTHAAALAHALAEVGLAPAEDPDPSRCPMRATDPITTRHPREDGWRCGYEVGHVHGHGLFTSDGEDTLYAGVWVHPADLSPTNPEPTEAP